MQIYILGDMPGFLIEVYVPDDQKYDVGQDEISIGVVRQQLEKTFGVSKVADVSIGLRNNHQRYTDSHAGSIFYGSQVLKDPLRVKSGWGEGYYFDLATQFQGKIKYLRTTQDRKASMIGYDALNDTLDAVVDETTASGLTVDNSLVATMAPMDILEYLIVTHFGLTHFNMDSFVNEDILDATSLATAKKATGHIAIASTTWANGSRLSDMLQGLLKLSGAYLYGGKDGKLYVYVYAPSMTLATPVNFLGDENVSPRQILESSQNLDVAQIYNKVEWTYGTSNAKHVSPSDAASIALYGERALSLSTKWNVSIADLDAAANVLLTRWSGETRIYDFMLSWLMNGNALAVDLAEIITLDDPAHNFDDEKVQIFALEANLRNQTTRFTGEDPSVLYSKYGFACSDVDESDGLGVTATNFAYWTRRFCYAGAADIGDPHNDGANPGFDPDGNNNGVVNPSFGTQDSWGNGIEEIFITF